MILYMLSNEESASEYSWIWEYTNVVGANDVIFANLLDEDKELLPADKIDEIIDPLLAKVGVKALDNHTLEIKLVNPTGYFVSLIAFYHFMPIKKSSVEDPISANSEAKGLWAKVPKLAVCNGPFKLEDYNLGDGLILVKNENYWNADAVKLERIEAEFIADANTAFTAFGSGSLDIIPSVPPTQVATLIAEDEQFHVFPLLGTYYMNFNLDREPFNNKNLRMALTYAVDRKAICDALGAGQLPAGGFVSPGFKDNEGKDFYEEAGGYGLPQDNSKYAEALTYFQAAATDMGITVDALRNIMKEKTVLYNTGTGHEIVAQMIQQSWKTALGFELKLQNQDWAVFQETRKAGDYDISRGGWLTDFMDPAGMLAIFTSENAYNDPNYVSDAFDNLMEEAQKTTDPAVHFAKMYEAQAILIGDMPIIPIYHYTDSLYIKSYVKGWGRSILGSIDLSGAYIEK
jgi:oligopeptide transport system substrate-binding protein